MSSSDDDDACVSVWLGDLDGTTRASLHADERHYAASLGKLPLAVAAHRLHARGELDLDTAVTVHPDFASAADGSTYVLEEGDDQESLTWAAMGEPVALRELVRRSLHHSANLAANLVLEQVGTDAVAAVLADAGAGPGTVLPCGIGDVAARAAGRRNWVTARDLGLVLAGLGDRRLADEVACAAVEEVLAHQEHRDGVPAGLPADTWVADKPGWVEGVGHDAALVRPTDAEPFVLVVLTRLQAPKERIDALIAEVAAVAWAGRAAR